ncbi:MAG TPA: phosphogluconate dehydratase, partial [Gammaproteobacteria bacterium]|nr:phosphogluconate dehydratase [Gammaproteobacteria bacterium]MCH78259.1 phosphogluconate dehydratase [Gammaproteobacteria bacterium]
MIGVLHSVTERVIQRSRVSRERYLALMERNRERFPPRTGLSCGNLAHAIAGLTPDSKHRLRHSQGPNIGIVSSYNEVLSAHQPLGGYPDVIRQAAREAGYTAQFAGGVPAMCDGV